MPASRRRFTLRQTRRTVPIMFSMMLVQANERRSSSGKPSRGARAHEAFGVDVLQAVKPISRSQRNGGFGGNGLHERATVNVTYLALQSRSVAPNDPP